MKERVRGFVADGAFVKMNDQFKNKCRELLQNPDLTFKWDILHLVNRSHIEARGKTSQEVEYVNIINGDDEPGDEPDGDSTANENSSGNAQNANSLSLTQLLNYVQCQSKKWRSGINYTELVLTDITFKRPKVWSSTRMSVYEYDQILRFLECKLYWDVPWKLEALAQIYCPVLFALRVMLRKVQKTDVSAHYINRVFKCL